MAAMKCSFPRAAVIGCGLGDDLTHLLVSSAHRGNQPDAAALVMSSVLRVCTEMKVECSRASQ